MGYRLSFDMRASVMPTIARVNAGKRPGFPTAALWSDASRAFAFGPGASKRPLSNRARAKRTAEPAVISSPEISKGSGLSRRRLPGSCRLCSTQNLAAELDHKLKRPFFCAGPNKAGPSHGPEPAPSARCKGRSVEAPTFARRNHWDRSSSAKVRTLSFLRYAMPAPRHRSGRPSSSGNSCFHWKVKLADGLAHHDNEAMALMSTPLTPPKRAKC